MRRDEANPVNESDHGVCLPRRAENPDRQEVSQLKLLAPGPITHPQRCMRAESDRSWETGWYPELCSARYARSRSGTMKGGGCPLRFYARDLRTTCPKVSRRPGFGLQYLWREPGADPAVRTNLTVVVSLTDTSEIGAGPETCPMPVSQDLS